MVIYLLFIENIKPKMPPTVTILQVFLLEAEWHSFERKYDEANSSYDAAINAASSAKYIHEQGLACELAALHHKRARQDDTAMKFFQQAKECYSQWGSQLKVDSITQQMDRITALKP